MTKAPDPILAAACGHDAYLCEILRAEGFNAFEYRSPESLPVRPEELKGYGAVLLGEGPIAPGQCEALAGYVRDGGSLIAFRPEEQLYGVFGIESAGETMDGGYLGIDTTSDAGAGLTDRLLKLHTVAECYEMRGCEAVAWLYDESRAATRRPAAVWNRFGKGCAAAFSYSLARNVVLTRQGNPALAGRDTDGISGIRPMDLFTGGWVDTTALGVNSADEQMRLLSHILEDMCRVKGPMPRLWYFPDARKSHVVLTNDGEHSTGGEIGAQLREIGQKGAGMTVYVLDTAAVSKAQADEWAACGHEVAAHPGHVDDSLQNAYAAEPTWDRASSAVAEKVKEIELKYSRPTRTCTNHWFVWCGRDESGNPDLSAMARIYAKNGIGMDCNYGVYDIGSPERDFLGGSKNPGNYTGSGLPMKLADSGGNALDVYQLINNVYDQEFWEGSNADGFYGCFKTILDRSLGGEAYSWIHVKAHNSHWEFSRPAVLAMLDYAAEKGIPATSAERCLDFLNMRDGARFQDIGWDGGRLSFTLDAALDVGAGLTVLLPGSHEGSALRSVRIDDSVAPYVPDTVKGREYAFVTVMGGGSHYFTADYTDLETI